MFINTKIESQVRNMSRNEDCFMKIKDQSEVCNDPDAFVSINIALRHLIHKVCETLGRNRYIHNSSHRV